MSDNNMSVDETDAANGNSSSECTIVSVYSPLFLYDKKDGTPFVPYSVTTNGGVYDVKETENADLKSGYADTVNN